MNNVTRIIISAICFSLLFTQAALPQNSGREFRRSAVHNANLVKTVYGNWGVIGQPASGGPRGAWIFENNGYIGDVSPMIGAEVLSDGKLFHSVIVTPVARPTANMEESTSGQFWGFEPDGRFFNANQQRVAMSDNTDSWPPFWPDKLNDPEDPGWRESWNGLFGKNVFNADQESFFVVDDNKDEEFNFAENNAFDVNFKPDSNDPNRNGLGFQVKIRGLQWSQFLAQDAIFWLYEILNESTTDYTRTVFGMLVGTYIGVTGNTSSGNEFDDDYSFFDVELDMTFTADFDDNVRRNPLWEGSEVGVVAYAFLESPGNPFDGIDNDGDAEGSAIPTGVLFSEEDFQARTIQANDRLVIIDQDFNRSIVTVPANDTVFVTRGSGTAENNIAIIPGTTQLVEGNLLIVNGQEQVNPNAFDGIDNDLDGLIDENFQLHFRQIRRDGQGNVLIDIFAPVLHHDYIQNFGLTNPLIDERRDDGIDNDGDWDFEFDDVGADGVANTGDFGEGDGVPTAGEPNFDQTDVDESDQIGLTSFNYFTPANAIDMASDEGLWSMMEPGLFEVPASIVNNKPINGEDGDFIYSSGHFPLLANRIERFSLALVYGDGGGRNVEITDLLKNRVTVQKIFDADYRFPRPPDKPTLTAVPGDGKITLYWDRVAENSLDPVLRIKDFEGYKIFKATDSGFQDAFQITDGQGALTDFKPIAQFDIKNEYSGFFQPSLELLQDARGLSFFLGENTGLQHVFVDDDVDNGRRYFYAVVAYDRGDAASDIFPSENTKAIILEDNGQFRLGINTAVVTPNAPVSGFVAPEKSTEITKLPEIIGTGNMFYEVVDQQAQTGHTYRLEFLDTSNDGQDNNNNWNFQTDDVGSDGMPGTNDPDGTEDNGKPDEGEPNVDGLDSEELLVPITYSYSVLDLTGTSETFISKDTLFTSLQNKNFVLESVEVRNASGDLISSGNYELDAKNGKIKSSVPGSLPIDSEYTISYQYYPVFQSLKMQGSPFTEETFDTDIFDGVQLVFDNVPTRNSIVIDENSTGFDVDTELQFAIQSNFTVIIDPITRETATLLPNPSDYEIRFFDTVVDTSLPPAGPFNLPGVPVNFEIWNLTNNKQIEFLFTDLDRSQKISPLDQVRLFEEGVDGALTRTWNIFFFVTSANAVVTDFPGGTIFSLRTVKPFRASDVFTFTTERATVSSQSADNDSLLKRIHVVPNPYIVATPFEPPLASGIRGRGERKIDFINLPSDAKVHIFTSRGDHLITIDHGGDIFNGVVSWNLKTKENLNIAYGMYFYVIESSIGTKRGKLAIIK